MKPRALDLCCGSGGWAAGLIAAGWQVTGYDTTPQPGYPGKFILADVRDLPEYVGSGCDLIVASPPCEEFTRHMLPWCKRRNPPPPDLSIIEACRQIAKEAGCPLILENVRETQRYIGPAAAHVGPFYLWGNVPAILPLDIHVQRKERMSSTARLERARIPFELAQYIGQVFMPVPEAR